MKKKIITYISHKMNHNFQSQPAHIYHPYTNMSTLYSSPPF